MSVIMSGNTVFQTNWFLKQHIYIPKLLAESHKWRHGMNSKQRARNLINPDMNFKYSVLSRSMSQGAFISKVD